VKERLIEREARKAQKVASGREGDMNEKQVKPKEERERSHARSVEKDGNARGCQVRTTKKKECEREKECRLKREV